MYFASLANKTKQFCLFISMVSGTVCDDALTHSRKGKAVMTDKERYKSVRHCKWAKEVVKNAPWIVDQAFLDKHKVAHGDIQYKSMDSDDVYEQYGLLAGQASI
ncbi:hypothetical protein BGX26_000817 [Mortierella sp. AD094]|nr:hypothetical protein BGX26_000817 [Mortierella sp. AD094]